MWSRSKSDSRREQLDRRTQLRKAEREAVTKIRHAVDDHSNVVRLFNDAYNHHLFPRDKDLSRWVRRAFGKEATKVIGGFAAQRCFSCKRGIEICDRCAGHGVTGDIVCRDCDGFGAVVCNFCNGSAFANYDFVPPMLRLVVIKARLILASALIKGPIPAGRREIAEHVLRVNRARGVIDNIIGFSRKSSRNRPFDGNHIPQNVFAALGNQLKSVAVAAERELAASLKKLAIVLHGGQGKDKLLSEHLLKLAESGHFRSRLLSRRELQWFLT